MVQYYLETVILNIYGTVFVSGLWQVIRLSFVLIYCVTSHIPLDIYRFKMHSGLICIIDKFGNDAIFRNCNFER